jgi:hypothetical protein
MKLTWRATIRRHCSLLEENRGHTVGYPASDLVPGKGVTNGYAIFACAFSSVPVFLAGAHTNVRAGSTV